MTTAVLTAGAALAAEGTAAAVILGGMAGTGQAFSTGLTIGLAYKDIRSYLSESAASETSLDKAKSISSGDPTMLWLALDLVAVILDVAALKGAFEGFSASVNQARRTGELAKFTAEVKQLASVNKVPQTTVDMIVGTVTAQIGELPSASSAGSAAAFERLATLEKFPAVEQAQILADAISGGDVAAVLSGTGKTTPELLAIVGKESKAGVRLQSLLNNRAYQTVGPLLRDLGLDDAAIARVVTKADVDKIKGQILEEVMAVEFNKTLAADASDVTRKALLRGAESDGIAEFIPGSRVTDVHHDSLTDGILCVLREGENGEKEAVIIRAFESKAGKGVKSQLSTKSLPSKNSRLLKLSAADQDELIKVAVEILRKEQPSLAQQSTDLIVESRPQEVLDIIETRIPQNEWGQASKTSQRLGIDVHPVTGEDLPAEILVDGVRRTVRFPVGEGRPQITGVLPSDLSPGRLSKTVSSKQAAKLDLMNVKSINQSRLNSLSKEIAEAKGYP